MGNLDLGQFQFERAAFEVRYRQAFLHWDISGKLWSQFRKKYPDLRMVAAEPSKTAFDLSGKYQLAITLESAVVLADLPSGGLEDFSKIVGDFISSLTDTLEIPEFTRIGLRLTYQKSFLDKRSCSDAFLQYGLIKDSSYFGIEAPTINPRYSLRWEGKSIGTMLRFEAEERRVSLEPNFGVRDIPRIDRIDNVLVLDVDYYTCGPVRVGTLLAADWIIQGARFTKKGLEKFLEGDK